jgi:hypothetical protein
MTPRHYSRIECFRVPNDHHTQPGEYIREEHFDSPPRDPTTIIMYNSPQRRFMIYGSQDEAARGQGPVRNGPVKVMHEGTWDELLPIFEVYVRML